MSSISSLSSAQYASRPTLPPAPAPLPMEVLKNPALDPEAFRAYFDAVDKRQRAMQGLDVPPTPVRPVPTAPNAVPRAAETFRMSPRPIDAHFIDDQGIVIPNVADRAQCTKTSRHFVENWMLKYMPADEDSPMEDYTTSEADHGFTLDDHNRLFMHLRNILNDAPRETPQTRPEDIARTVAELHSCLKQCNADLRARGTAVELSMQKLMRLSPELLSEYHVFLYHTPTKGIAPRSHVPQPGVSLPRPSVPGSVDLLAPYDREKYGKDRYYRIWVSAHVRGKTTTKGDVKYRKEVGEEVFRRRFAPLITAAGSAQPAPAPEMNPCLAKSAFKNPSWAPYTEAMQRAKVPQWHYEQTKTQVEAIRQRVKGPPKLFGRPSSNTAVPKVITFLDQQNAELRAQGSQARWGIEQLPEMPPRYEVALWANL